jgi:hypothetical protein
MNTIQLSLSEIKEGWLPPVCIRCGEPATSCDKILLHCVLPAAASPGADRATASTWADMPFCDVHRDEAARLTWRARISTWGFLATAGAIVCLQTLLEDNARWQPPAKWIMASSAFVAIALAFIAPRLPGWWFSALSPVGIVALALAFIVPRRMTSRAVQATRISDADITLVNVSHIFIGAVETKRKNM